MRRWAGEQRTGHAQLANERQVTWTGIPGLPQQHRQAELLRSCIKKLHRLTRPHVIQLGGEGALHRVLAHQCHCGTRVRRLVQVNQLCGEGMGGRTTAQC